jgi:hypothetical protein
MRYVAVGLFLLLSLKAVAQGDPEQGKQEVVIPVGALPRSASLKAGAVVNVTVEEPGAVAARTQFIHLRIVATAEDKRIKGGHTVTVRMTAAQAKAFEALKDAGTVTVEPQQKGKDPKAKEKTKGG